MQAEVLSVGTELLLGQTVNTDTTIVAKALSALGIDLLYAAVVGDNVGRLEKAVYDALDRSDILITTGGLGPTGDDLTKETVAAAAGKKLATAESCTGGMLAKRITDIPGSSAVFETGCVTYANCVKERLLGVPHETLVTYGAVSEQTARAMAEGIVRESGADIGVGITGIAGPDGGTEEKPVGLVYIALSDGKNTWVAKRQPMGRLKSREWHRHCAASKALDMVRRYHAGLPVDEA